MKNAPIRNPGAGISRGMWIALAATLALTAGSYGVRAWRESQQADRLQADMAERAPSTAAAPGGAAGAENAASPAATAINPANGLPMPAPSAETIATPTPAAAPAGLRPPMPTATMDPMGSSRTPPPLPVPAATNAPPPAPAELPPPSFRLVGLFDGGAGSQVVFSHNDQLIVARPGTALPDGFRLQAIRPAGVIVVRTVNKEKIEFSLGAP